MPGIGKRGKTALAAAIVAMALLVPSAPASAFIYWGNFTQGMIGRAGTDGSGVNPAFITGAGGVVSVAVDENHIYWANETGGTIGRANIDGSGVDPSFISGIKGPNGVTVSSTSIYWTAVVSGSIGKANLDGTNPQLKFIPGLAVPCGVATDAGHVYWGEGSTSTPAFIGRADLSGSDVKPEFIEIPGTSVPCGVAVDSANVFWTEPGFFFLTGTRIGRANKTTGAGADPSFIGDASGPCGIARNGSRLYWTNAGDGAIARANSDGTGVEQGFIPGVAGSEQACGIAVDGLSSPPAPPPGPPAPDTRAPVARISKGPGKKLAEGVARFSFRSDEKGSTFRCKLDSKKQEKCRSPKTYKNLEPGRHTFKVWATDAAGNRSKPAKRSFRVPA
jgi:hypothetical protein